MTNKPLDSLEESFAFDSRDWSSNRRDAWCYGIICGWGGAFVEICERFNFNQKRLKTLRNKYKKLQALQ